MGHGEQLASTNAQGQSIQQRRAKQALLAVAVESLRVNADRLGHGCASHSYAGAIASPFKAMLSYAIPNHHGVTAAFAVAGL